MEGIDKDHIIRKIPFVGGEPVPGTLVEMVYRPEKSETAFAVYEDGKVRYGPTLPAGNGQTLIPYSPNNNLVKNAVVLFPSEAEDYGSETELVAQIQSFIHQYVDLTPFFESIAAYYVLLTWVYEAFNELPYLRLRGDFGSGKTRFLLIVGSLCFRPIFSSGASTISPLFRMLDAFKGTLIVDESDFRMSDEKAEFTKIFNNGNARGFPVLRSESSGQSREFNPQAYHVFGPKIVAMRGSFADRALESRFITEETGGRPLRRDIPISLPDRYRAEALRLRNKLLTFRFRTLHRIEPSDAFVDRRLEPRVNQIFGPLLRLVADDRLRDQLLNLAKRYHKEMATDRGTGMEAQILEVIRSFMINKNTTTLPVGEITREFNERFGAEHIRPFTSRRMGNILRQSLHFDTYKSHGLFVIPLNNREHLQELFDRYQIEPLPETAEVVIG